MLFRNLFPYFFLQNQGLDLHIYVFSDQKYVSFIIIESFPEKGQNGEGRPEIKFCLIYF